MSEPTADLEVALKEADHVQTILGRYDQGFVTIKTAYAVCVATLLVGKDLHLSGCERAAALVFCALFFAGFELFLRYRYWASWAFRISKLSDLLVAKTGFYELIGTANRDRAATLDKPTRGWRFQVAKSEPDLWYYGASVVGAAILVLMQGSR